MSNAVVGKSLWQEGWKRLARNRVAVVSGVFIVILCFMAVFAYQLSPYAFDEQYMDKILAAPTSEHWLGTDSLGRDMLSRLIHGARMSMAVGIVTALISLFVGAAYGAVAGWMGGRVDALLMRFVDILYSVPTLVLLILVKVIFDSVPLFTNPELKALTGMLLALSVVGWVTLARMVRGQVLQVKQMVYIEAAQALGASGPRIVMRHIFPNILGPIIVILTFQIPSNILYESFLSFLGLGLQPPYSSWGVLANEGWRSLRSYPHLIISPGIALFTAMLAFNLLGDGLRDAFDPQMKDR
ncbi:MAG: ABC transporter permease [Bdellovibrionales bacterium]